MIVLLRALALTIGVTFAASAFAADDPPANPPAGGAQPWPSQWTKDAKAADATKRLPADSNTDQTLSLSGRTLNFKAGVNVIHLTDDKGAPEADVVTTAYQLKNSDARTRPVTFVFNGGPGAGSAWLQLGAVGPWRLPMNGLSSSSPPTLVDNEETWLDFTDLVFVDPPATGYSRIVATGEDVRKKLWSVSGDIDALSVVVRRWLADHDRLQSPKFILGESYGGFRGPRLAEELSTKQGIGINGLVLISPALQFGGSEILSYVTRLPSFAAAFREKKGKVTRDDLADVEQYATHDYLLDLLKGPNDAAAVERVVQRVTELTGLDPEVVKRFGGRISKEAYLREFGRADGKVSAFYDATITAYDPEPTNYYDRWLDPATDGFGAPFSSAMMDVYNHCLGWKIDDRYEILNEAVGSAWNWGNHLSPPSATESLRKMLALDPNFRVLVTHGLTDLQTPYFNTALILDQIPNYGAPGRLTLKVYPGGHMHYSRDDTRKALRDDAMRLIEGK
jgi:carboxypeptidase C (cathepsin A)